MTDQPDLILGLGPDGSPVGLSRDGLSRHVFVCGATGSGKTSLLLSSMAGALSMGSGCMFVDGKGDREALDGVKAIVKHFGREDDLYVIDLSSPFDPKKKKSHTFNPFARSSASAMTDMLISMMDKTDGEGRFWKGRAIGLLAPLMQVLTELRDHGVLELSFDTVREHLNLSKVIDVTNASLFPMVEPRTRRALRSYLTSLPGFVEERGYKQSATALDQHGYLEMQFTRLLGTMSEEFGHVFCDGMGEIDLTDIIDNKRILVFLLTTASRSQEPATFIGNIVITMLKDMIRTMSIKERRRPSDEPPFLVMLDEFGQYTLPGAESVIAQARSLGLAFMFATQSLTPSWQDSHGTVLTHILANTKTKILMRTDFFDKASLEKIVPSAGRDDEEISDLRARMSQIAGLISTRHAAQTEFSMPSLMADYEKAMKRHDVLVESRGQDQLAYVLPSLEPGEMRVVTGGRILAAKAFDMSGLPHADYPLVNGMEMTHDTLWASRGKRFRMGVNAANLDDAVHLPKTIVDMLSQGNDIVKPADAVRRATAACFLMGNTSNEASL